LRSCPAWHPDLHSLPTRRSSDLVQAMVVERLKEDFPGRFVGTSNVHLARLLDVKPMGTMAHEWIMAHQQLGPRLIDSQSAALDRSEEHTSELQSRENLVCRLLLE